MSIDNDKFQFVSQFNCTHFNYLYAFLIRCTHFLRGVRKLYQNRYLHTAKKHIARCAFLFAERVDWRFFKPPCAVRTEPPFGADAWAICTSAALRY